MKKINRRDYLLQMGAGAVGVMSSAPFDILAESVKASADQPSPRPPDLLWKPTDVFPSKSSVTVIFGGLFGFFYNSRTGNCEIGEHKGDRNHRLMIEVWERISGAGCHRIYSTQNGTLPKPKRDLIIEIVGRPNSDVKCYQVGAYDRKELKPEDFRWLPDLDSDDFYPMNYPKVKRKFNVKSIVRHGTFYTYQKTNSTFTRVEPPNVPVNHTDLYHVAEYMAAGIQPNDDEDVSLKIDDNSPPIVLKNRPTSTYDITILNNCYKHAGSNEECTYEPNHPTNEMHRNHFHFMRKIVRLPRGQKRYGLKLKDGKPASKSAFCPGLQKDVTDEAPCMGAAFGKTDGMP